MQKEAIENQKAAIQGHLGTSRCACPSASTSLTSKKSPTQLNQRLKTFQVLSSPSGVSWLTKCEFCKAKLQSLAHRHRHSPCTISCLADRESIKIQLKMTYTYPICCCREARTCDSTSGALHLPTTTTLLRGGVRDVITRGVARAGTHQAEPQGGTTGKECQGSEVKVGCTWMLLREARHDHRVWSTAERLHWHRREPDVRIVVEAYWPNLHL